MNAADGLRMTKSLTIAYIVALTAIAASSLVAHGLLDRVIARTQTSSTIINISGRQRMLSQRIDLFAHKVVAGDKAAIPILKGLIDKFEQGHQAIILQNGELGLSLALSPNLKSIYFNAPDALDIKSRAFITAARVVQNSTNPAATYAALQQIDQAAIDTLLPVLDKAVHAFTDESIASIHSLRTTQLIVLAVLLITLLLEALFIFRPLVARVKKGFAQLFTLAMHDALTGIPNRRYFMEEATRLIALAQRHGSNLAFIMLDIDHFKKINDLYGHAVGDEVIKKTTRLMQSVLRASDLIGRLGGEEFAVILPYSDLANAVKIAEKLRLAISESSHNFAIADNLAEHIDVKWTVSVGVTDMLLKDQLSGMSKRADDALYSAKIMGATNLWLKRLNKTSN